MPKQQCATKIFLSHWSFSKRKQTIGLRSSQGKKSLTAKIPTCVFRLVNSFREFIWMNQMITNASDTDVMTWSIKRALVAYPRGSEFSSSPLQHRKCQVGSIFEDRCLISLRSRCSGPVRIALLRHTLQCTQTQPMKFFSHVHRTCCTKNSQMAFSCFLYFVLHSWHFFLREMKQCLHTARRVFFFWMSHSYFWHQFFWTPVKFRCQRNFMINFNLKGWKLRWTSERFHGHFDQFCEKTRWTTLFLVLTGVHWLSHFLAIWPAIVLSLMNTAETFGTHFLPPMSCLHVHEFMKHSGNWQCFSFAVRSTSLSASFSSLGIFQTVLFFTPCESPTYHVNLKSHWRTLNVAFGQS